MDKNRFVQIEEKILKFWKEKKIFEKSVEQRPENNQFVFYDGPPFATGLPHYGHILASVIKDLFPRYYTMKGYRVRRRWGWDCHGLPIETLVEKELGISGKKQIEERGVELFNQTARSMVQNYVDHWQKTIERIGRFVEFENSYKTMDTTYMESVWWFLKKVWDEGLIYEGRKVLLYCPRCETPVSNAEIAMDNSYKDVTEESLIVKFKLKPGQKFGHDYETKSSAYVLAWTTTPWTLPGNVALAVGEEIDYTALRIKGVGELYILATELVESVFKQKDIEIVHNDLKGRNLVGLEYEPLFIVDEAIRSAKTYKIYPADFVTTEEGTGVVHTAVVYGEDDYKLGLKVGLPVVPILDSSGRYNEEAPEVLRGQFYKSAEKQIKDDLVSRDLIFEKKSYTHSYPFCWRCESPLIYNAISAWFIDIQKKKNRLIELNEGINWYPPYLKGGRFLNILETAPDWNISRNRYWATALPFFKCQDKNCGKAVCIGSIDELKEKSTNFEEVYGGKSIEEIDLHRPFIDAVKIKCECGQTMTRIPEVIDCWVESGSMPFAEWHYPFENKENFESRYPGDFIGEYISQTRAWFYYMHVVGTYMFDKISFKNVVATGVILNEKGEKMSKSRQNYPDPWEMLDKYGADALRFYILGSTVMQAENLFFNERELRESFNKIINTTYNIFNFYQIYANDFKKNEIEETSLNLLDRFILSRLQNLISAVTKSLDNYNTVTALREIKGFIDELSTWWLRRSRERFRHADGQIAFSVLIEALRTLSKIMAPITPFMAEEIWQEIKTKDDEESVHLAAWPNVDERFFNSKIEEEMGVARKIVELGHALRARNGMRLRQPLGKINFNYSFSSEDFNTMILDELNVEKFTDISDVIEPLEAIDSDVKVVIDKKLDDRLIGLGDLRELTRNIQQIRKKDGLDQSEMAVGSFYTDLPEIAQFIEDNSDRIKEITNLTIVKRVDKPSEKFVETEISLGKILFSIEKQNKN